MEKLNRAQKCSILGPQNLGSGGAPPGSAPVSRQLNLDAFQATKVLWLLCFLPDMYTCVSLQKKPEKGVQDLH